MTASTSASGLAGCRIALGVGGGIAAYKNGDLIRSLRKLGAEVRVAMTPAAREFVTPLTLASLSGHPVLTDYFDPQQEGKFGHLDLARWADVFAVVPATADLLSRIAQGQANCPVSTALLAFRGPVLLAPAMNTAMWEHAETQANVQRLKAQPRYLWAGPEAGLLADGDVGMGRLAEQEALIQAFSTAACQGPLAGQRVLITAGPTREFLDPVRFVSNPSTGRMGIALADEARRLGAHVTLVLGPTELRPQRSVEVAPVVSAQDMAAATWSALPTASALIAAAAVSDFRPAAVSKHKLKKSQLAGPVEWIRTPDILAEASARVREHGWKALLVGFAAETEHMETYAREKLAAKQLDYVVANQVGLPGQGFESKDNRVVMLGKDGSEQAYAGSKGEIAQRLWSVWSPDVAKARA